MARVPVATQTVRQAPAATPYQRSIATVDDFGGTQARSLIQGGQQLAATGDMIGKRALQMQIEDNEREAKALDVEFSKRLSAITYGDDQNEGYYASRGENAIKGYKDTTNKIEEARRQTMEGVANPRVREMFGTVSAARVAREGESLSRHVAAQRRVANDSVSEARLNEAADDAGRAWNDPKVVGQSMAIVRGEVQDMAERNGWAPEVTASKMQEAQTVLHRSVINSAMVSDPAAAKAYFDKNKDKIDGRVHADIEKAIEAGTLRQQSQAAEDSIMARGMGEAAALAEARKIKDPKLRDETVARVTNRYAEAARIDARAEKANREEAWSTILKGGSSDDLTPQQLAALGTQVSSIKEFEARRAKDGRGYAKASDPDVDNTLHRMFIDDKLAFAEYDMTKAINGLTEERYNYWRAQQRTVNKADEKAKEAATSYALSDKIARQFMPPDWRNPAKGTAAGKENAEKAQRVYEAARGVVDTLRAEGKRATAEDVTKAMKELFLTGEADPDGLFNKYSGPRAGIVGTDKNGLFVLTDIPKQKQQISDVTGVPVDKVEAVVKALKEEKLPVTAQNIRDTYEKAAARGK